MKYLLNSAVITSPGLYRYSKLTPDDARHWYEQALATDPIAPISTIGYAETAAALAELLGRPIIVDRRTISMEPGDEALVFRIVLPPGSPRIDPTDKGRLREIITRGQWELGLLERLD
jgi:hypothetical protein